MRARTLDRIEQCEARAAKRAHCGVILFSSRDQIPDLLAQAAREGRACAPFGVLVLPHDCASLAEWESVARAYRAPVPAKSDPTKEEGSPCDTKH